MKVLRHPGRFLGSARVSHTVKCPLSPVLLLGCLGLDLTSCVQDPAHPDGRWELLQKRHYHKYDLIFLVFQALPTYGNQILPQSQQPGPAQGSTEAYILSLAEEWEGESV